MIRGIVGGPLVPRRATLAKFRDGGGATIDNGVALYFQAPHSYTGEEILELQGHGGPVVLHVLLARCLELGARLAQPGEFTRRAFLNGKLDLAQAEAVIDLIDAATTAAARCAARSLDGEFSAQIQILTDSVRELRALVEATLDFPDEEIDFLKQHDAEGRLAAIRANLARVLDASRQGRLLREGLRVVIAGRPNVGKSSLLNTLSGRDLAIVTDVPGTTRDAIREQIEIEGLPIHVVDTAGLRESGDTVEQIGISRTRLEAANADLIIEMIDATTGETDADRAAFAQLPPPISRIRVVNKVDAAGLPARVEQQERASTVWMSAKTGAGVELLRKAVANVAGWQGTEGTYLARARHLEAMRRAEAHLAAAGRQASALELLAEELRLAHDSLGSIIGRVTADDLLGDIFSRFCIGK